jgi:hypothetical protein
MSFFPEYWGLGWHYASQFNLHAVDCWYRLELLSQTLDQPNLIFDLRSSLPMYFMGRASLRLRALVCSNRFCSSGGTNLSVTGRKN